MFAKRFKSELFATTARTCKKLDTKSFTFRLKENCLKSGNFLNLACKALLRICTNIFSAQSFKVSRNTFKLYQKHCCNFATKKLMSNVFKRFPTGRPLCTTFAAAACSFSWEDNEITEIEIQT